MKHLRSISRRHKRQSLHLRGLNRKYFVTMPFKELQRRKRLSITTTTSSSRDRLYIGLQLAALRWLWWSFHVSCGDADGAACETQHHPHRNTKDKTSRKRGLFP